VCIRHQQFIFCVGKAVMPLRHDFIVHLFEFGLFLTRRAYRPTLTECVILVCFVFSEETSS
jgi:hypothetical protein